MSRKLIFVMVFGMALVAVVGYSLAFKVPFFEGGNDILMPKNGMLLLQVDEISDGKAHFFKVKADDGVMVRFFVVKSADTIIRAAIDACDVCYKAGKGYVQTDDYMVCENCGQRFATNKINEVKGGCNPAPLARELKGGQLQIAMKDINAASWYCKYKK